MLVYLPPASLFISLRATDCISDLKPNHSWNRKLIARAYMGLKSGVGSK